MQLDTVKVGQKVNISSRMTGAACTGEVVEISTYPTDGDSYGGDGNPNVSYYPFKVFVSEDQQLQEGESVSISYQAVSDSDGSSAAAAYSTVQAAAHSAHCRGCRWMR